MRALFAFWMLALSLTWTAAAKAEDPKFEFETPFPLMTVEGKPVDVIGGGYACPCWADVNGDGYKDLLIGQLTKKANIRFYLGTKDGKYKDNGFLQIDGKPARVPGIG